MSSPDNQALADLGDIYALLIDSGIATPAEIEGVGDKEIAEISRDQGVALPAAYEAFLRLMGRRAGRFFVGTDVFYPRILGIRRYAEALLAEDSPSTVLGDNDVVVGMHQGYEFVYLSGPGDDPPAFAFCEGDAAPRAVAPSFTAHLRGAIVDTKALERRLHGEAADENDREPT